MEAKRPADASLLDEPSSRPSSAPKSPRFCQQQAAALGAALSAALRHLPYVGEGLCPVAGLLATTIERLGCALDDANFDGLLVVLDDFES